VICFLTLAILHRLDPQRWQHSILPHTIETVKGDEHRAASFSGGTEAVYSADSFGLVIRYSY